VSKSVFSFCNLDLSIFTNAITPLDMWILISENLELQGCTNVVSHFRTSSITRVCAREIKFFRKCIHIGAHVYLHFCKQEIARVHTWNHIFAHVELQVKSDENFFTHLYLYYCTRRISWVCTCGYTILHTYDYTCMHTWN
jgi:hypothetical protein